MTRSSGRPLDLASIAAGGCVGATVRWMIAGSGSAAEAATGNFPIATLVVNALGCLVLGALVAMLVDATARRRRLLVAMATGFCGSLTTFSAFAVETAELLRSSEASMAVAYVIASLALGGTAFVLGKMVASRSRWTAL